MFGARAARIAAFLFLARRPAVGVGWVRSVASGCEDELVRKPHYGMRDTEATLFSVRQSAEVRLLVLYKNKSFLVLFFKKELLPFCLAGRHLLRPRK
jgi:hypothetical protein